jgi:hypothetical protein
VFEALADETVPGWRRGLTTAARGALNRATKELKSIQVLPDEIPVLVQAYRRDMPTATLTPSALAKHAPRLRAPQARDSRVPGMVSRCDECGLLAGIDCHGH